MSKEEVKKSPVERYLDYQVGCRDYHTASLRGEVPDVLATPRNEGNDAMPVVHRLYYLKHYLGVLLTSIEVLGLPERQEKSFKDVVKKNFWDFVQNGFVVPVRIDYSLTPTVPEIIGDTPILTEAEAQAQGYDTKRIQSEDTELINI